MHKSNIPDDRFSVAAGVGIVVVVVCAIALVVFLIA